MSEMTLRDQFAMAAIPAIIRVTSAGQHHPGKDDTAPLLERMASDAYEIADAMLKARESSQ